MAHLALKNTLVKNTERISKVNVKFVDSEYAVLQFASHKEVPHAVNILRERDEVLAFEYRDIYQDDLVYRIFGDKASEEERKAFKPKFYGVQESQVPFSSSDL